MANAAFSATQVGLTIDIGGYPVPILVEQATAAANKGVEFNLEKPLPLGSLDDLVGALGVDLSTYTKLPEPIGGVFGLITEMEWTVSELTVTVPAADGGKTTGKLQIEGHLPKGATKALGPFKISGVVFGASV